jgi:hypothetical protein
LFVLCGSGGLLQETPFVDKTVEEGGKGELKKRFAIEKDAQLDQLKELE